MVYADAINFTRTPPSTCWGSSSSGYVFVIEALFLVERCICGYLKFTVQSRALAGAPTSNQVDVILLCTVCLRKCVRSC